VIAGSDTDCAAAAITVADLRIDIAGTTLDVVDDIAFALAPGEILGLVGESGSGKTTLGLALLGHARRGLHIAKGRVLIGGQDVLACDPDGLRRLRGKQICYIPQDPASALNPTLRIGDQLRECLPLSSEAVEPHLMALLEEVKLPAQPEFLRAYPHQLSGGQQQRMAIAMAFANRPRVIVMDEPTTGLDVTTQSHVLDTVRRLCAEHAVAAVYISHDLAVVASIAARVAVMYSGRIVEIGPTAAVLRDSSHPYTRALVRAVPDIDVTAFISGIRGHAPEPHRRPRGCSFAPRCPLALPACAAPPPMVTVGPGHGLRCFRPDARETTTHSTHPVDRAREDRSVLAVHGLTAFYGHRQVLHDITFSVPTRSCLAIVGESGSGKTTLARCLAGLHAQAGGRTLFQDQPLAPKSRQRPRDVRRRIQYIFQNPYASLNPSRSIGASLAIALRTLDPAAARDGARDGARRIHQVLEQVALPAGMAKRYPNELSGGQRQRVAIARALLAEPELLICDEITSALDVSVQAVIIELLTELQRRQGLSLVFVTHNLALVRNIAQTVAVLQSGRIVEYGEVGQVLDAPKADETRRLLQDAPRWAAESGAPVSALVASP
jgi:peptide/nickel transport system ATP-binding protein